MTSIHFTGITFPDGWNITESENHWSTTGTMKIYLNKVLVPYFDNARESLNLPSNHTALLFLDVFAAHRSQEFLNELQKHNIHPIFIPAGCTGDLQPLDVAVNDVFKRKMKEKFSSWYSEKVGSQLKSGKNTIIINDYKSV